MLIFDILDTAYSYAGKSVEMLKTVEPISNVFVCMCLITYMVLPKTRQENSNVKLRGVK